jgi:hypothetical protein
VVSRQLCRYLILSLALVAAWILALPTAVRAEPPELNALSPAGVQVGGSVSTKILGKTGTAPVQAWCDRSDLTLQVSEKGDELAVTAAADAPAGIAWIRLYNTEGASTLRPFLIGLLPEVAEAEPNNTKAEAQTIPTGGITVNGALHKRGEVDTYAVPLQAGQTLVASVESSYTLGSPMDGVLQLLSPDGSVIRQNDDDHGADPQVVSNVAEDGVYLLRLFAFPREPDSSIEYSGKDDYVYRLTVTTEPFVDRVEPSESAPGSFDLRGWNLPDDVAPVVVQFDQDAAHGTLPYPGTWQFERMPAGTNHVRAESLSTVSPVTMPAVVWGTISTPGEQDEFTISAVKAEKLSIRISARSFASQLDPLVQLLDQAGSVLLTADDEDKDLDPDVTFDPPADGQYRIVVRDRFAHGGERYTYAVEVRPATPMAGLETEKDAFTVAAGETLEIPVIVSGVGDAAELAVGMEGVPEGFSVSYSPPEKPVEQEGRRRRRNRGNDGPKGTLKLQAAAGTAFSGPVTIVGTLPDGQRIVATAALPGLPFSTRRLWLTATVKE